jgi:type VI secretion system protein ImpJ
MEPLRPLFWGQGMLLQPQHFQQQDQYHEGRLRRFLRILSPFDWGVYSLRVNEAALRNFVFEIEQCEIITFEGSLIRFGPDFHPNTARISPRSFEQNLNPTGKPTSVYLSVRRSQPGEAGVGGLNGANGAEAAGSRRRFALEESEVPDFSVGNDRTCQVQYLVYDCQIMFDAAAEISNDYELVKLAEVQRPADGKGAPLSRQYIAPSIALNSSPGLEAIVRELRDLITAKGRELGSYSRGGERVELAARGPSGMLIVQTLNRYIPLFHHHLEVGCTHPAEFYAILRQLVGELSSFSATTSALGARDGDDGLPPYQHTELWPCYSIAASRARELLEELTATPVGDVALQYDGEYFSAALSKDFLAGDNRYYLAIRSDLAPGELYKLLQDTGKITSRGDMPKLQKSFLFGLKIEALESAPEELVMRAHYRYFLIDQRSEHWQKIREQENIAVYSTALAADTEIRLLAIWGK